MIANCTGLRVMSDRLMAEGVTRRAALAALAGGTSPLLLAGSAGPAGPKLATPFIRTQAALEGLRDRNATIDTTGAKGDGSADDTAALQEILEHYARVGGEWHIPPGVYRTTAPLIWRCTSTQLVRGQGKRRVYPGKFDSTTSGGLAVLMPTHAG